VFSDWNLNGYGRDCALVFGESEEWLLGCSSLAGKSGFIETGETWNGAVVLWNSKSFYVDNKYVPYEQIKLNLVGTVGKATEQDNPNATKPVLILQDWGALHKNHPGFQDSNMEEWLGIFVHEAFHAHQMWHPQVFSFMEKWSKETIATADELVTFYKANDAFQAAVKKEHEVLKAAVASTLTVRSAKDVLRKWLDLYRERRDSFEPQMERAMPGKRAWMVDGFETFLEGTARYVEAKFLISPAGNFSSLDQDPTFKNFVESKGKNPSQLPGLSGLGGKYFYSIGMYLSFLLDVADPEWKGHVFETDGLLLDRVIAATK